MHDLVLTFRFSLFRCHNYRYAQYSHFKIHSEADYYKLEIDGYEGNAGDSLNDLTYGANNSPFSTYNRDNDRSSLNCASMLKVGCFLKLMNYSIIFGDNILLCRAVGGGNHVEEA
jgi:hypothetical protein